MTWYHLRLYRRPYHQLLSCVVRALSAAGARHGERKRGREQRAARSTCGGRRTLLSEFLAMVRSCVVSFWNSVTEMLSISSSRGVGSSGACARARLSRRRHLRRQASTRYIEMDSAHYI